MSQPPSSGSAASGGVRNPELLGVYVNDHLAAATGGVELVSRMLSRHSGTPYEPKLEELLDQLREERSAHVAMAGALGIPVRAYKQLGTWVAEKLTRAKLNGRLFSRSPLSDLVEFEFIATAVLAKRAGFETLLELSAVEPRLDRALLERLVAQADEQHRWLADARREVASRVFGGRPDIADRAADT